MIIVGEVGSVGTLMTSYLPLASHVISDFLAEAKPLISDLIRNSLLQAGLEDVDLFNHSLLDSSFG